MARKNNKHSTYKRRRVGKRQKRGSKQLNDDSKFAKTLSRLKKLNPSQRQHAMTIANNKFIQDFSNQVKKLRRRSKHLTSANRKQLQRHRANLRKLANNRTSIVMKRRILCDQRGGLAVAPLLIKVLPSVIAAATTAATSFIGRRRKS